MTTQKQLKARKVILKKRLTKLRSDFVARTKDLKKRLKAATSKGKDSIRRLITSAEITFKKKKAEIEFELEELMKGIQKRLPMTRQVGAEQTREVLNTVEIKIDALYDADISVRGKSVAHIIEERKGQFMDKIVSVLRDINNVKAYELSGELISGFRTTHKLSEVVEMIRANVQ